MAFKKIADLPAAGAAALTDLYETEQGGVSKQETLAQMQSAMTGKQNAVAYSTSHTGPLNFTSIDRVYTNATGKVVFIEYFITIIPDAADTVLRAFIFRGSDGGIEFSQGVSLAAAGTFTEYQFTGTFIVKPGDTLTFQHSDPAGAGAAYTVEYFETQLF